MNHQNLYMNTSRRYMNPQWCLPGTSGVNVKVNGIVLEFYTDKEQ